MTLLIRLVIVVLILCAVGCRKQRAPEYNSEPAAQANVAERPANAGAPSGPTPEKPSLSCRVENVSLYPVPNSPENLSLSLIVSVQNSGAPTTVQDWKLTI